MNSGRPEVSRTIEEAVGQIGAAIADLRELANGVRPANLDNGLGFALRELARRTPVPMEVCAGDERFPSDVEATAYFVACEAVTNAVKHATARRADRRRPNVSTSTWSSRSRTTESAARNR